MDFYLVTGFLGAGKTTFLKNFIQLFPNQKIYLIINEFGAAGVDGTLLADMNATLAEINNGSIFCACRLDKFEETLMQAIAAQPDVIITEASGLADPTNVQRVLAQYPSVQYKGSVCLVDSVRLERVFSTAVVCPRQLSVASLILLNKTDLATPAQLATTKELVQQVNPAATMVETAFGVVQPQWLTHLTPVLDLAQAAQEKDITLQKQCLLVSPDMPKQNLERCLAQLSESSWRMKGFITVAEGDYFVDCTGATISMTPWQQGTDQQLVVLAGRGMPLRKAIKLAVEWYPSYLKVKKEY
ncbi:MAG: GTP-binding protein [Faecalibacterium sp.]